MRRAFINVSALSRSLRQPEVNSRPRILRFATIKVAIFRSPNLDTTLARFGWSPASWERECREVAAAMDQDPSLAAYYEDAWREAVRRDS